MNFIYILRKKMEGIELSREEIAYIVDKFTKGEIPDYQMAIFLASVYFNGMNFEEIAHLTSAMMHSGEVLNLSSVSGIKVDKHSTGGVGDKVSLILAPLVASCGVVVPMISGRGLGHTGGTLDKLESIPGFRTALDAEEFIKILKQTGVAIIGQTEKIVPADKKLYALRDATNTVASIPLIASSIMSKKLTEGIDGLVLDVKTGNGAFMQKLKDAKLLARTMIEIGKRLNKKVVAVITDMNQPLGRTVGNALEVEESVSALKGDGGEDLMEVTYELGACMLLLAGKAKKKEDAKRVLKKKILTGEGLKKFKEMVESQSGDSSVTDGGSLQKAKYKIAVESEESGYVKTIDTLKIGSIACSLGAGRMKLNDRIDHSVGLTIEKKISKKVKKGELLAYIHTNDRKKGEEAGRDILECYKFSKNRVQPPKTIIWSKH